MAAALAGLLFAGGAKAGCTFLVDLSGSMAGFHAPGQYQERFAQLTSAIKSICPRSYGFTVGEPIPIADPSAEVKSKDDTHLDEAFGWWLRQSQPGDTVVLLTDNVADDRTPGARDAQQRFYDQVRSKDADIFGAELQGLRLPFSGKVFSLVDTRSEIYQGDRALALYLIAKKSAAGEAHTEFLALRERVADAVSRVLPDPAKHHAFTVRPFEELGSELASQWIRKKLKIQMQSGFLTEVSAKYNEQNRTIYVDKLPRSERGVLEVPLSIKPGPDFDINHVRVSARFVTTASSISRDQPFEVPVTPETIDIAAGQSNDVMLHVPVLPFDWADHPSLMERLKRLFWPSPIANGHLEISYQFERKNIAVNDAVSQDWHTGDREGLGRNRGDVQRRLYLLQELLRNMATSGTDETGDSLTIPLQPIEMRFRLDPSMNDNIKLLLVLLVIGATAAGAYLYLSKSITYELSGHGGGRKTTLNVVGLWHGTTTPLRAHVLRLGPVLAVWWTGNGAWPIPSLLGTRGGTALDPRNASSRPSLTLQNTSSAAGPSHGFGGKQGSFKP